MKTMVIKYAKLGVIKPAIQFVVKAEGDYIPICVEFNIENLRLMHVIPDYTKDKQEYWNGPISWDHDKWVWNVIYMEALKRYCLDMAKDNGFDSIELVECNVKLEETK